MTIDELKGLFSEDEKTLEILDDLSKGSGSRIHLKGICGSAQGFIASVVAEKFLTPHLFILSDKEEAAYFYNDLQNLTEEKNVFYFPSSYRHPYQEEELSNANVLQRAETLEAINNLRKKILIVTYPGALGEKVVTKKNLRENTLVVRKGEELSIDFMNELLIEYGFEKVDFVAEPGQFSVRGGIVDIFSYANDYPYRVEFFGDEIESIRSFDAASQLSQKQLGKITIIPNVQGELLKESRQSFLEFIPPKTTIWLKNIQIVEDKLEQEFSVAEKAYERLGDSPVEHLPPEELYFHAEVFRKQLLNYSTIEFGSHFYLDPTLTVPYAQTPQPSFNKNFELLFKDLQENEQRKIKNVILAGNAKQIERLYHIFEDIGKAIKFTPIKVAIHEGFIDNDLNLACYTDHQIFERYHRFRLKEGFQKTKQALTLKELTNLQPGDFVTHIDHGVGQFSGLEKIDVNGKPQEAIRLIYKGNDILYVSIHSLHRISKYTGKDGAPPKVNKLGSNAWKKLKQKTKRKVKEIAFDLIKLYAKRKAQEGFAFSPDTYLQNELEASFIYEDTPDQLKATQAVKEDMEQPHPMDRLICGDVGFGKTEIAIRAAFKAVSDSKQVAVLAPTTILTLQHHKTFSDRLKDFPCNVDYINRFKTGKKQRETLKKLKSGEVDIIIGTHRLIGKDIEFKDLGLLIIDEEQKFGVGAKDKLKTLRTNVDALTLTATPIPRTLQFSLMNARDLSVINTPPPNRYPVQTELHAFNEAIIRDAVYYEVSRGGQVFFVNNRVENIEEVAGMIQRLCPDVRIGIGHGQMEGAKLEQLMFDFIEGEYDVLVATTIIESGLDIPNANTIIINNANHFGLSDLHQMRGRVGRSNKKAFCYLLSPPLASLTPEARKRLKAIEQFSELGSGFNIAMKDLDIRGAGNLLGAEQTGFISEIGYDMYQKILDEAIQELKENEFKDLFQHEQEQKEFVKDCQIDTDFNILIPDDYVNNITERLSLYKELADVENEEQLQQFEQRLTDRFGPLPEQTQKLLDSMRLKWIAKNVGFEKVVLKSGKLIGYFVSDQESPYFQSPHFTKVLEYLKRHHQNCQMKEKKGKLSLVIRNIDSIEKALKVVNNIISAGSEQVTYRNE